MNRDQVELAVTNFFSTRMKNKPNDVLGLFAEGAKVRMAGASAASSIAHRTKTTEELRASIDGLVSTWQWIDVQIHSLLIEGNSAAVRYDIKTIHLPTGTELASEAMDQFFFDDESRITELVEFVDTARVAQLEN